ncbi:phosphatase PAP2 family protein [Bradyrhizobium sp. ISRA443]|uniref:phosphatase PAP2 family protein n=1 Tax=unclassified Bradyrhizobium TaxID=2631580 RepID=UPI00247A04D8|nr:MULTISPECIES: phosphatase PAP2 family protein [unclassified Bradyrhizobium]WGR98939.1 phosphatase PAP2 family protein [Bradyrhizobium sp. ISRA436]WGS05830.1 phosphatase PAP2 family protein [Bradyrhizobium sp. ISRA437]WGS12716.1 phosphatase PAP2 family protein [Bradyrhizobium sp. ISRA443]
MSSISGIEKPTASAGVRGLTLDPIRVRPALGRWFMFSDYGAVAQRHMAIVWSCVVGYALVDVIWLQSSGLSFAPSNWTIILKCVACSAFAGIFIAVAHSRLAGDQSRPAILLRGVLLLTELLWRTSLPIGGLLLTGVTLTYLITAANLPLRDNVLAHVDRLLGFDWLSFLQATNSSPLVVNLLARAYNAIGPLSNLVLISLVLRRRGDRITEFMAVLSLSTVAVCIGMALVPAAGAFAYFHPAPQLFANFSALGEMWPFLRTFLMLRDGTLSIIDLSTPDGIVSFPSFHTMLGLITIYAARDTRWLLIPVLIVNATMILATMPVGGHHLSDVLAGGALTIGAILLVRRQNTATPAPEQDAYATGA